MSVPKVPLRGMTDEVRALRHAETINALIDGKANVADSVTLTANAATTSVSDNKFESAMVPVFVPLTANAAAAITGMYISARTQGGFTLTHANNAQTDRSFGYVRFG
jgi:hypothetical protein